jgi:hypothetical protein
MAPICQRPQKGHGRTPNHFRYSDPASEKELPAVGRHPHRLPSLIGLLVVPSVLVQQADDVKVPCLGKAQTAPFREQLVDLSHSAALLAIPPPGRPESTGRPLWPRPPSQSNIERWPLAGSSGCRLACHADAGFSGDLDDVWQGSTGAAWHFALPRLEPRQLGASRPTIA